MRLGSAKDVKTLFSHFAVALAFRCICKKNSHLLITSVNDIDFPFSSGQCASQYRRKILRLPFSMSFLHCQVVARVFLSLMLVRRKILRLYFCLMEFIVKRHVRRHYATCKRIMRQRCIVTSVARLCLFGVALFFLTYFICADIFILYLCIKWSSARQCQVR